MQVFVQRNCLPSYLLRVMNIYALFDVECDIDITEALPQKKMKKEDITEAIISILCAFIIMFYKLSLPHQLTTMSYLLRFVIRYLHFIPFRSVIFQLP